jgi:uncharacterized repeat protein (TIGR01451 family)
MSIIGENQTGTIINAENFSNIFTINKGVTVNIQKLTLTNGTGNQVITTINYFFRGGAIFNEGNLTIEDCSFTTNVITSSKESYGGAISNRFGNLTVTNCIFSFNKATYGGAIDNEDGLLNVVDSIFTNNTALQGGAISAYRRSAITNCNVTGSTFTNNSATTGGAIANSGNNFELHYNRIIENTGQDVIGIVNATANWWGTNFDESNPFNAGRVTYGVTASPWIYLALNATPTSINNGATSLITASFNYLFDGTSRSNLDPNDGHIPDGPVQLDIHSWGSFINPGTLQTIILDTVNGATIPITYYANGGQPTPTSVNINGTADGYTTVGTASAMITINKVADLTITKYGPSTVLATDIVSPIYTIFIQNNGPDPAEGVSLTDTFITGINAFKTGTLQYCYKTNDDPWTEWASFVNPLTLNLGIINVGKNVTILIQGTMNASTPNGTIINNTATTCTTTTPGDKNASCQTIVNTFADLNVTKIGPTTALAGTTITYTLTITNGELSDAQNVQLVDDIPAILQNVTHDNFNLGTIYARTSKTVQINGTIPSNTIKGTLIQNNATVTSTTSGTITPSLMVTTTVDTLADVDLNKTVNNTRPDVGNIVTFTVTAHNYGPSDATNIQILDMMPSNLANVSITPSKGTYNIGTGIWALNLINGEEATLNLTGTVTAVMAGKNTTNTANKTSQTEIDPDTIDTANATIYVPKADLYIQITSDKNNPYVGQIFILTYKLGNKGPDDALNVFITIPLPSGFVISQVSGDGTWIINGNTIIWTMTNVTVGDPFLYISGWTSGPGIYVFSASITSQTFNVNSIGVSPFSINIQPQANAATTNTIGMQTTGAPIAGIVLGILMVLGGFISTRKKQ